MKKPLVFVSEADLHASPAEATEGGANGNSSRTSRPRFFRFRAGEFTKVKAASSIEIPVVDLGRDPGSVVEAVQRAAAELGFFLVVGHCIPQQVMDGLLEARRRFHDEKGAEEKASVTYDRDGENVLHRGKYKLFTTSPKSGSGKTHSPAGGRNPILRSLKETFVRKNDPVTEYADHVSQLGATLFKILNRPQGLFSDRLTTEMEPDPESAAGARSRTTFLSVLLQDQVGGIQVLHGDQWIDVQPTPGALFVNVGEILQIVTNEEFIGMVEPVRVKKRFAILCRMHLRLQQPTTPKRSLWPLNFCLGVPTVPHREKDITANGRDGGKVFADA